MAKPAKVSYEQVAAVADKMIAQHEQPTARKIRETLGVGSMSTIVHLFHQWEGGQVRQSQTVADLLSHSIAHAISEEIANKVQAATAAITLRLANLQDESEALIAENKQQESDIAILATEQASLLEQNAALTGRIQQLEVEAARIAAELNSERNAAEAARVALAKSELRLEAVPRIEAEIEKVREELRESHALAAELHEVAAVATAKMEAEIALRKNSEIHLIEVVRQREEAAELKVQLASLRVQQ